MPEGNVFGRDPKGRVDFSGMVSVPRLLDKQLIRLAGEFSQGYTAYVLTPLGKVVADFVSSGLNKFESDIVSDESEV